MGGLVPLLVRGSGTPPEAREGGAGQDRAVSAAEERQRGMIATSERKAERGCDAET